MTEHLSVFFEIKLKEEVAIFQHNQMKISFYFEKDILFLNVIRNPKQLLHRLIKICVSVYLNLQSNFSTRFAIELFNFGTCFAIELPRFICKPLQALSVKKNTANFLKLVGYKYQEYNSIQCKELVSDLMFFHLLFHFSKRRAVLRRD